MSRAGVAGQLAETRVRVRCGGEGSAAGASPAEAKGEAWGVATAAVVAPAAARGVPLPLPSPSPLVSCPLLAASAVEDGWLLGAPLPWDPPEVLGGRGLLCAELSTCGAAGQRCDSLVSRQCCMCSCPALVLAQPRPDATHFPPDPSADQRAEGGWLWLAARDARVLQLGCATAAPLVWCSCCCCYCCGCCC